jgi:hypothetical protein
VLNWVGIPNAGMISIPPPRLKRQADSKDEIFLEQYLEFKAEQSKRSASSFVGPGGTTRVLTRGHDKTSDSMSSPLLERSRKLTETASDALKHWIVRNYLLGVTEASLIAALIQKG